MQQEVTSENDFESLKPIFVDEIVVIDQFILIHRRARCARQNPFDVCTRSGDQVNKFKPLQWPCVRVCKSVSLRALSSSLIETRIAAFFFYCRLLIALKYVYSVSSLDQR